MEKPQPTHGRDQRRRVFLVVGLLVLPLLFLMILWGWLALGSLYDRTVFSVFSERHHAQRAELTVGNGLISNGWLPEAIPASARDIRVLLDGDNGAVIAKFTFDPADLEEFRSSVRQVAPNVGFPPPERLVERVDWWDLPVDLGPPLVHFHDQWLPPSAGWFAIDPGEGRGWYWSLGEVF